MNIQKNIIVEGNSGLSFLMDHFLINNGQKKPIIVFAHGFKGFKDWGHWDLIAQKFAQAGYVFIKFNFSHNGTTIEHPSDFGNLPAFGENNFSKELQDLGDVLDKIQDVLPETEINLDKITLIGHSRGGGIGILKAAKDERIKSLVTWASVASLSYFWEANPGIIDHWRSTGVFSIMNGRTKQEMPLNFQLYEDFMAHADEYDIKKALENFNKPFLILHGSADPAVPLAAAEQLHGYCETSKLKIITDGNHVFGGSHPFVSPTLPAHSIQLVDLTLDFLKENG